MVRVGRAGRLPDVFMRTKARVYKSAGPEPLQSGRIKRASLALVVRPPRPPHVRPLPPLKTEPFEILQHRRDKLQLKARGIQVFVAQDQAAAGGRGPLLGNPKRARVAQVQVTRRRRRQAAPVMGLRHFDSLASYLVQVQRQDAKARRRKELRASSPTVARLQPRQYPKGTPRELAETRLVCNAFYGSRILVNGSAPSWVSSERATSHQVFRTVV